MLPKPQFPAHLITLTEEISHRKLHFFVQWFKRLQRAASKKNVTQSISNQPFDVPCLIIFKRALTSFVLSALRHADITCVLAFPTKMDKEIIKRRIQNPVKHLRPIVLQK